MKLRTCWTRNKYTPVSASADHYVNCIKKKNIGIKWVQSKHIFKSSVHATVKGVILADKAAVDVHTYPLAPCSINHSTKSSCQSSTVKLGGSFPSFALHGLHAKPKPESEPNVFLKGKEAAPPAHDLRKAL